MRTQLVTSQVEYILGELCVHFGLCLPANRREWIQSKPPADVDAFADAVLRAEGLNPQTEKQLRRGVREMIAKHWKGKDENKDA